LKIELRSAAGVFRFAKTNHFASAPCGAIHTPKRLRRATVRLGFFRCAAVKDHGSDGEKGAVYVGSPETDLIWLF
jgi:hypothetical protein